VRSSTALELTAAPGPGVGRRIDWNEKVWGPALPVHRGRRRGGDRSRVQCTRFAPAPSAWRRLTLRP